MFNEIQAIKNYDKLSGINEKKNVRFETELTYCSFKSNVLRAQKQIKRDQLKKQWSVHSLKLNTKKGKTI